MNEVDFRAGSIIKETVQNLQDQLGDNLANLTIERVVIGLFFTGVKLSNGQGGACFTPVKTIPEAVCCPSSAKAMPSSGQFRGKKARDLLADALSGNSLKKALGIAIINALTATCWERNRPHDYCIEKGNDALEGLEIPDNAYVVVVGALAPILRVLKKRERPFGILEIDPRTLKPDEMPFYFPPDQVPKQVPQADILVITGTTLINDTLEGLLALAKPEAKILVVGPTVSMLPEAFFRRGVETLGGILVTKPDELLDVISEAGSGYHFFGKSAERIVVHPK